MCVKRYSDELKEFVNNDNIKRKSSKCQRGSRLGEALLFETDFLIGEHRLSDRLFYVKNDIFNQVKCPVCNNLSKYNISDNTIKTCSRSCSRKRVDPITGLKLSELNALKTSNILKTVNKSTGLTKSQEISIKRHKTMSIVGLNGKTGYETSAEKSARTMSIIDIESNLSIYNKSHIKGVTTKKIVNNETGLSVFDIVSKKQKKYMYAIDDNNNEKNICRIQRNRLKTLSKINLETGLTRQDEINSDRNSLNYDKLLGNFKLYYPEYSLITSNTEYKSLKNKKSLIYSHKCGKTISSLYPSIRCLKCYPYNKSSGENEVLEFCKSLILNVISNSRSIIKPLELDIHIPDHNLAIEYNGLFWHSSYSVESENKNYHLHKTRECEKQGIQLFHIFENEWLDPVKQVIWKSIISNKLGKSRRIYARKTEVRSVSSKDKIEFLDDNHLQGNCQSSVNLGLYVEDELVSLMTFGRSRYDKNITWELIRFCNMLNTSVVGGASRLLKAFRKNHSGSIVSYADKRRSNGHLYKQLGFEFSHESTPNYWYYKDPMALESRIKYQKHKLKSTLGLFDNKLTEAENMYRNGYRKIYDCGNQVWKLV